MGREQVATPGVFVTRGMTLGVPPGGLKVPVGEDGAVKLGMPYQNLINLYLRDCAANHKNLKLKWAS